MTRWNRQVNRAPLGGANGFSLIEVIIAMVVLVVGLVSLLALFSQAIGTMQSVQEDLIVKQKAKEALESIYTARNTQQITWDRICNVADGGTFCVGPGVFLDGLQPLRDPNPAGGGGDGLIGTADDGNFEVLRYPGPDGLLGTPDDVVRALTNIQRQIDIQAIVRADGTFNPDLRQVMISFQYNTPQGKPRIYQVGSYISRFR